MEADRTYCKACKDQLPWIMPGTLCPSCGKKDCICLDNPCLNRLYVPLLYKGSAANAIKNLKFYGKRSYSRPLGELLGNFIRAESPVPHFDCIIPIPMTKRDIRKRGYSQSTLIARFIGQSLAIPVEKKILVKVHQTKKQHCLNAEERKINLKGAFVVTNPQMLKGKSVLLCDDVLTTGATLQEAARMLKEAGASDISAVVVATTEKLEIHAETVV